MKSDAIYRFQIVVGLMFIAAGLAKVVGADMMVRQFEVIGLGQWYRPVVGALEIIGGLSLFIPRASAYAAALLACVIIGSTGAMIGHIATNAASAARPQNEVPQITTAKYYHVELVPVSAFGTPTPRILNT
jgi:putative oxidoreductase